MFTFIRIENKGDNTQEKLKLTVNYQALFLCANDTQFIIKSKMARNKINLFHSVRPWIVRTVLNYG